METKEMVCIVCPMGCRLTVTKEKDTYKVEGNTCPRGEKYAIKEMTNPTRVVTTTVKIKGASINRLPVKTKDAIPKEKIFDCMRVVDTVEVVAPVCVGDVIVENLLDTGIDLVAAKSMESAS